MNVLLYVLDALRADHLSCYGYERNTSPTIDSLAAEGVRFEQCFTPATWTRPVATTLTTGLYPPAHGTQTRNDTLTSPRPTLAEQFSSAGYETVGITSMGNVSSATGFDRGFDRYFDLYKEDHIVQKRKTSSATDEELREESGTIALPRAADINDAFAEWLDERADRDSTNPFFTFCWSIEPHIPYDPPSEFEHFRDSSYDGPVDGSRECLTDVDTDEDLSQLRAHYDEEIRYNDHCIGEMIQTLRDAGEFDDTLICIIGDHGDAFMEHGRLTHGHAPYDELVRVPWVARPPTNLDEHVVNELVSLVDVYPTLLEATGIELPNAPNSVTGQSVAKAFDGKPVDGSQRVFFETKSYDMERAFYGVRTSASKYMQIESVNRSPGTYLELIKYVFRKGIVTDILRNPMYYWQRYRYNDGELLFDLEDDPEERKNLVDERPEQREVFEKALDDWLEACQNYCEGSTPQDIDQTIGEQTKEQLRQLGYTE